MITLILVKRMNPERGYSTALLGRGYLTSLEIPQQMKRTIQVDEKNNFIDTNLLANMDILNLRGSGFRTVFRPVRNLTSGKPQSHGLMTEGVASFSQMFLTSVIKWAIKFSGRSPGQNKLPIYCF